MRPASAVTALAACSRCIRRLSVTSLHGYHVLLLCCNSYRRTSHDFSPLKTTISCPCGRVVVVAAVASIIGVIARILLFRPFRRQSLLLGAALSLLKQRLVTMSNQHSMLPPIALPYPVQPQPMYDVASGFQGAPPGGPFLAGVGPTSSATGGPAPQGQPVSMMAPPYIGFAPAQQPPMGLPPTAPPPYGEPTDPAYGKPYGTSPGNGADGDTAPLDDCTGFSSREIRQAFVRKVYAILMVQLTITFGAVALFIYEPHVKSFVQNNGAVYISAYVSFIVMYIALICCKGLRRSYPANIIVLFLFVSTVYWVKGPLILDVSELKFTQEARTTKWHEEQQRSLQLR
ncbi:protein lifeguard 1 [Ixodes scapularis]